MSDPAVRLAEIRAREQRATPGPWDVTDHHHYQDGCKRGSCHDVVGWVVDHPEALDCEDRIAKRSVTGGEKNEFGRELRGCSSDPLLSFEDADFAAQARTDVPLLLDALEAVLTLAADFDAVAARNRMRANLSTSGMAASGSADAYASAARRLREALATALDKEKTTDARS